MTEAQLLVFARCLGFMLRAPGFSHPSVPPAVRAGLAFAIACGLSQGDRALETTAWARLAPLLFIELAIGAALGIAVSALFDGAYCGGRLVDDYVGIRISVPTAGLVAGAGFGRLWSLAFTSMFFVLGGDALALRALTRTFDTLPVGFDLETGFGAFAFTIPRTIFQAALTVAGPALGLAFAAQLGLAAVGRIVPRFGTFGLTFGIALACALVATLLSFPSLLQLAGKPWLDFPTPAR